MKKFIAISSVLLLTACQAQVAPEGEAPEVEGEEAAQEEVVEE